MRRQQQASKSRSSEVDMTSMVDVTFLLLIFFMVTAAFQLQKSIAVPAQREWAGRPIVDTETASINIQIDQFGSFLVTTPEWELETPGKQNLIVALKQAAQESPAPAQLAIEVHEEAKLESLVDALDAGTTAGMATIQITQSDYL